jgi:hypothetical protein
MTKVSLQSTFKISPDEIWKLIGQFNALPDWHPAVQSSTLEDNGRQRRLQLMGGGEIIERLETIDEKDRLYRYSIVSAPLPVANYTATLRVRDDGSGNALVEWSSEFEPAGAAEADAIKSVQGIYQAGFDSLKKMFGM